MLHNETDYPDAFRFKPERFLRTGDSPAAKDPAEVAFGFGRRLDLTPRLDRGLNLLQNMSRSLPG